MGIITKVGVAVQQLFGKSAAEAAEVALATAGRRIALRIEVDTGTGELVVEIDDPDGPGRFVRRDGEWSQEST